MTNQEMLEIAMRQSAEDMGGSLHTGDHGDRF